MRRSTAFTILAAYVTLGGCTLALDADRHQSNALAVEASAFCGEFATLYCDARALCCDIPGFDAAACEGMVASECADNLGGVVLDSRTGYDSGRAGVALAEGRALALDCDPAFHTWFNSPEGLRRALLGTLETDETCSTAALASAADVSSCIDDGVCTSIGTLSDPQWICVPPAERGEPCSLDGQCVPGLRCSVAVQLLQSGTCEPLKADGEACGRNGECETFYCDVTCMDAPVDATFCMD